ncbi:uncharacterized protein LOC133265055 isoform X2 [Pezoporus flaviventris]|uniref:uncharacterized protein LOC133265055 isoform X2 n=1 Tax=Pezoporus flaviventris TaxID=889875 RepID=UPI002AB00E5A|nr:uncharacterized protein LOC133265055 isoform X2 [Pezoporus flaviventris]
MLHPAVSSQHLPSPILAIPAAPAPLLGGTGCSGHYGSTPQVGSRGKSWLGSHTALSLPLPHAQTTGRSSGSPGDPAAIHQDGDEGAEWPPCCECPSCLCSVPRGSSSPASAASLLTFCSFPLAQEMTQDAGSLKKLLQHQAQVRVCCSAISPIPTSHTQPEADAALQGPFLLWGSLVSAAHFLQAGARQLPVPVLSSSEGLRGHVDGGTHRSRRRLPWPLARPGTSAAVGAPGPSGSAGAGALFGRPLADLCSQDGMLPQPIQDLLAVLNECGPSTEGIFQLAASQRACREVREALDSGVPVQLETQPVLLLAVLLKDLLRNIPSKLLNIQLFEEWMHTMEKTRRQEKLSALKEVASKLPEANLLLLWHLLSLLSSISKNVATTKMTAGNLAICLAPSLLSLPQELPLDVLALETGKVTKLIKFLIEHHQELLGEQVARLASKGDEETPAAQAELETAEVPPVAPESEQQRSFSREKRFPGSSHNTRKRKAAWEEGSDGPPCQKKIKTELSGMGN